MKIIKDIQVLLVAWMACWCLTGFSQTTNSFYQFVQDQSKRQYTQVPHEVLAFYYGWYSAHDAHQVGGAWGLVDTNKHQIERTARYPAKGAYDSHDPAIIDWQIDQAKQHGITGFIVSWWGIWPDQSLNWHDQSLSLLLEHAEKKNFKVSIYWEVAPGDGQNQIEQAVRDLSYVLKKYGGSKAFLKVDGKPVIFAYNRVMAQVAMASWPSIIEGVRARGGDFVLIADGYQGHYAYLFDGLHIYTTYGCPPDVVFNLHQDNLDKLHAWVSDRDTKAGKFARQRSKIFCALVTPGFDGRKAYKNDLQTDRLDGQTYRMMWEEAIKANPDWVLITSWNEWPEGTEIEPSFELGDKYLQITDEYAKRFLNGAPVDVPPPVALAKYAPGTTNELDKLLSGQKIGVLMEERLNDTEFWAACCGADLQRFAWRDLIDPKVFNASNIPVLICITAESYTSSIKVTDDVTDALVRYLHEGGFLVSVPVGPWPFTYDDSRKGMSFRITDKLELGVSDGFEQPPVDTDLKFYVNKRALSGLPPTTPFPTSDDLRFRPASRSRVSSYDYYLPLVQLWDGQMHFQGDAAVYIQHRIASLSPGKSIYVWMRTAEALGPDKFYPSLYQFISTKLKLLPTDK
jgi:hypothetical protein